MHLQLIILKTPVLFLLHTKMSAVKNVWYKLISSQLKWNILTIVHDPSAVSHLHSTSNQLLAPAAEGAVPEAKDFDLRDQPSPVTSFA